MASEVDIYNLALTHLGDSASVSSPTEASTQAAYCRQFYSIARDMVMEGHDWGFATTRTSLALLAANETSTWLYAYAVPSDCLNTIAVLPSDAGNDYNTGQTAPTPWPDVRPFNTSAYQPQPYALEALQDGTPVIYTNQQNAVLRYTRTITDPGRFPPTLVMALSYQLAALVAGPLIKGDVGQGVADKMQQRAIQFLAIAHAADVGDTHHDTQHVVPWIAGR